MNEPNMKVKAELSQWIDERPILDRRVVDKFGTEIVIVKSREDSIKQSRYDILRGFALGDGAGVSVDEQDLMLEQVVTHLLEHYSL
jgi:hypothetical protein